MEISIFKNPLGRILTTNDFAKDGNQKPILAEPFLYNDGNDNNHELHMFGRLEGDNINSNHYYELNANEFAADVLKEDGRLVKNYEDHRQNWLLPEDYPDGFVWGLWLEQAQPSL